MIANVAPFWMTGLFAVAVLVTVIAYRRTL
jgi:hypothetical protein